jgi:hypothetical protein
MTHTKDEALKLALEALLINCGGNTEGIGKEAITAIKQARSAPVQEPIYQMQMMDGKWIDQAKQSYEYNKARGNTVRIVYTTPPAQPAPEKSQPLIDLRQDAWNKINSPEQVAALDKTIVDFASGTKGQP